MQIANLHGLLGYNLYLWSLDSKREAKHHPGHWYCSCKAIPALCGLGCRSRGSFLRIRLEHTEQYFPPLFPFSQFCCAASGFPARVVAWHQQLLAVLDIIQSVRAQTVENVRPFYLFILLPPSPPHALTCC